MERNVRLLAVLMTALLLVEPASAQFRASGGVRPIRPNPSIANGVRVGMGVGSVPAPFLGRGAICPQLPAGYGVPTSPLGSTVYGVTQPSPFPPGLSGPGPYGIAPTAGAANGWSATANCYGAGYGIGFGGFGIGGFGWGWDGVGSDTTSIGQGLNANASAGYDALAASLPGLNPIDFTQSPGRPDFNVPIGSPIDLGDDLPDDQALLIVHVPTGADVYLQGRLMEGSGSERRFISPKLRPGETYSYKVRVTWKQNRRLVDQESEVTVRAGQQKSLTFVGSTR